MIRALSFPDHQETETTREPDEKNIPSEYAEQILKTGRVFCRNLSYQCTEKDLFVLFEKFGKVSTVTLIIDTESKLSKGYAFVQFENALHALGRL